jgi:hypothetical protein
MVSPIVGTTRLSMVLMDGGSGLNILYATLDRMGILRVACASARHHSRNHPMEGSHAPQAHSAQHHLRPTGQLLKGAAHLRGGGLL